MAANLAADERPLRRVDDEARAGVGEVVERELAALRGLRRRQLHRLELANERAQSGDALERHDDGAEGRLDDVDELSAETAQRAEVVGVGACSVSRSPGQSGAPSTSCSRIRVGTMPHSLSNDGERAKASNAIRGAP